MPQGWGSGVEEAEELRLVDDCGVAVRGHVAAEVKEEAVGGDEAKGHAHAPRRLGEAQDARRDEIAAGDGLKRVAEERDAREVEGEQFALRHHAEGPEAMGGLHERADDGEEEDVGAAQEVEGLEPPRAGRPFR